jgi:hypothetical protein
MKRVASSNEDVVKASTPKPRAHHAAPRDTSDDDENDRSLDDAYDGGDPDAELDKLGAAYRAAHPEAKFTREQAIAHVMQHDPDGQRLSQQSKEKNLRKYYR